MKDLINKIKTEIARNQKLVDDKKIKTLKTFFQGRIDGFNILLAIIGPEEGKETKTK